MRLKSQKPKANRTGVASRKSLSELLRAVARDQSGSSVLELAIAAPVLITMFMFGAEIAYMAVANMQVTQIATSISDNASRIGQTDNSGVTPTVTENEIDTIMGGAMRQGEGIEFEQRGRIILSSLEHDSDTGRQFIHWQRCRGDLEKTSDYGSEGAGLNGDRINGLGTSGHQISAKTSNNSAVMFAEVFYEHEGIFGDLFVGTVSFKEEAAFEIRDDRNLEPGVTGSGADSLCN